MRDFRKKGMSWEVQLEDIDVEIYPGMPHVQKELHIRICPSGAFGIVGEPDTIADLSCVFIPYGNSPDLFRLDPRLDRETVLDWVEKRYDVKVERR